MSVMDPVLDAVEALLAGFSRGVKQDAGHLCQLETADTKHVIAAKDGSLISILKVHGCTQLVGPEEFERINQALNVALRPPMSRPGHAIQAYFCYDKDATKQEIKDIFAAARQTSKRLNLALDDLFNERIKTLSRYCASESVYFALWTRPNALTETQRKQATKNTIQKLRQAKIMPFRYAQNFMAAIPDLRETHDSFVRSILNDMNEAKIYTVLMDVHDGLREVRKSIDPEFTAINWQPSLPGDKVPIRSDNRKKNDISEILWPPLSTQLIPRDAEIIDLRTCRIGDRVYTTIFIDLFPKELQSFVQLFRRVLQSKIPWRMSFLLESDGIRTLGMKPMLASILSFASTQNPMIADAAEYLRYIQNNTDDTVVKLRVSACTWAPIGEEKLLRMRTAELSKAMQGWGYCEVGEVAGDPYEGVLSSSLGIRCDSVATGSAAPLSDVIFLLPYSRPASTWVNGALLFRTPEGKPWPYQPGSTQQTTWIDLIYARPGSGKSVLSNSINLALCLQGGIPRLPRIAIVDIGPSSSGLISLIKEALPADLKHLAAYHRIKMTPEYSINPFDTQLGCRKPTSQERAFLVNFLTLLATPVGQETAYDGISDMAGMVVTELFNNLSDDQNPHRYTADLEPELDKIIQTLPNFNVDQHTTWWEITDELFKNDHLLEANIAQRYAMPLLADAAAICRTQTIEDLYGKIMAPTGEPIIGAFSRMISSAVREYPILSRITAFNLGDARVISLDLDEVAKSGGDAADRQTAVMYMLARYVMARHYYLTEDALNEMPQIYHTYHKERITEIREDPKRIVFDEFHRTSKAQAVRDQVIVDMREGRKWKVQVALLSQSLDDFDSIMVEFATSTFIMDAGPKQAIEKSVKVFGLSDTARIALETRVHGPRAGGATMLAQFSTKSGINTQLLTSTIGPIELWAFNTTAEDTRIRNALYERIGAQETRNILATLYPSGSAASSIEERLGGVKETEGEFDEEDKTKIIDQIINEIIEAHGKNNKAY